METFSALGPTKKGMLYALAGWPQGAPSLSKAMGIRVSAVRKHLEALQERGIVRESVVVQGVGRPKKLYLLTERGKEMLPRQYDIMLNEFISMVSREKGKEYSMRLMNRIADNVGRGLGLKPGRAAVFKASEAMGFMPVAPKDRRRNVVVSRNCPLMRVAFSKGEAVCSGFHERLLKIESGASRVSRESWMNDGDPVCTHVF